MIKDLNIRFSFVYLCLLIIRERFYLVNINTWSAKYKKVARLHLSAVDHCSTVFERAPTK